MGIHKRKSGLRSNSNHKIIKPIKRPNNIGKRRRIKTINGDIRHFVIEDEILRFQHKTKKRKLIAFQKIRFEEKNRIEYRLGYYMIGVKPRAKGRWVWGQFCLLIPERDLNFILKKAETKGWFSKFNRRKSKSVR